MRRVIGGRRADRADRTGGPPQPQRRGEHDREPGDGVTPSGPEVTFLAEVPSAGGYRLFLDFQHEGTVHTAVFPVVAS